MDQTGCRVKGKIVLATSELFTRIVRMTASLPTHVSVLNLYETDGKTIVEILDLLDKEVE